MDRNGKYEQISKLADDISAQIASNPEEWKKYLTTASRIYKYPFKDQVLIYAQRPDATACASIEIWNKNMNCWINRGAHGIALIDGKAQTGGKLRYVFDVSDVHKAKNGRDPGLWVMQKEHESAVIEQLGKIFDYDKKDDSISFEEQIAELSKKVVNNNMVNWLPDFEKTVNSSEVLRNLPSLKRRARIGNLLSASIAYSILSRCNADISKVSDKMNFSHISEFSSLETITLLGDTVSNITKPILMEIGRAIKSYDIQKTQEISEKELEKDTQVRYNTLKRESDNEHSNIQQEERGNGDDEHNIRTERGLHDTQSESKRGAGRRSDQVRTDETQLSEGGTFRNLSGDVTERKSEKEFTGNTGAGAAETRRDNGADVQAGERQRGTEGQGSNALGKENGEHQEPGRGDRGKRDNIYPIEDYKKTGYQQLSLFPSEDQQIESISKAVENEINRSSAFLVPESNIEITFTVAESGEFHNLGEYHEGISSIEEAVEIWKGIPPERMNGIPSIGINLHEKGTETYQDIQLDILNGNTIDYDIINSISEISSNAAAMDSIKRLAELIPGVKIVGKEKELQKAQNFHITDDALGLGTAKEKFHRNIAAIRILKNVESENRQATPKEQQILSQYVGWGGLADAFDDSKTNWSNEYQELKLLLTAEEYEQARSSTLNAHYTSPAIIQSIYGALGKMGFRKGNVLEPAMGIGNFFGMLPETMQDSHLYGVELDSITGRIAKQLYPNADIQIKGFEKTDYPNDFFDVAVGNVPFGQYKVSDKAYDKKNFLIHDYFFAKTLDKVRPGGVIAFVTSKGTMDKKNPEVRKYLAQRAELLGAVRLPNTAFKENAGTEVTSDILFFKKRDRMIDVEPDWVHVTEKNGIPMNQYFADHPEMIVGKWSLCLVLTVWKQHVLPLIMSLLICS